MKILLLLSMLSSYAFAQDIKIGFTKSYNLILRSNSCDQLQENREAICKWKESLGEINEDPRQAHCQTESNGQKRITISSCLPEFTKQNHRRKLYNHGANCWGTALSFKKISLKPRFVWSKEMVYWMNSPICRKLEVGETKKPGDILNIYGPEYKFEEDDNTKGDKFWDALFPGRKMESPVKSGYTGYHNFLHSETYITESLMFGKDSPNKDDKFDFHPGNEVYGRPRSKNCQERQDLSPHSREYGKAPKSDMSSNECRYFSVAYRCESFNDFFNREAMSPEELAILAEIKSLQNTQQDLFSLIKSSKRSLTKTQVTEILTVADYKSSEALTELTKRNFSKRKEMLLTLKFFSAEGIRKSLELADLTTATERL